MNSTLPKSALTWLGLILGVSLTGLLQIACSQASVQGTSRDPRYHEISYTSGRIAVDGKLEEGAWKRAKAVEAFAFPWWESGDQEQTEAKLLWDDEYLYVSFVCQDAHIWAEHQERDSPVYKDDCVEVFTSPDPDHLEVYFNVEMNALGVSLDFLHPEGPGSKVAWDPEVKIETTIEGSLNDDSDTDRFWVLEAAIPFAAFKEVAKHTPPQAGDEWRLNLHRLGGKTNPQFSQWSPAVSETVLFHAPEFFGRVVFVK